MYSCVWWGFSRKHEANPRKQCSIQSIFVSMIFFLYKWSFIFRCSGSTHARTYKCELMSADQVWMYIISFEEKKVWWFPVKGSRYKHSLDCRSSQVKSNPVNCWFGAEREKPGLSCIWDQHLFREIHWWARDGSNLSVSSYWDFHERVVDFLM